MKRLLAMFFLTVTMAGVAWGQQQPKFTTCSQVAEYTKQSCGQAVRPMVCQSTVEQNRINCMATGTWQKGTFSGGATGAAIANLRRE